MAHRQPLALRRRVIVLAAVVRVKELLEPLQELKVILEATLHQFVNGYYLQKKQKRISTQTEFSRYWVQTTCLGRRGLGWTALRVMLKRVQSLTGLTKPRPTPANKHFRGLQDLNSLKIMLLHS